MIDDLVFIFMPTGHEELYQYTKLPYHPRVGEYVEMMGLGIWRVERVIWQVNRGRLLVHLALDDS